MVQSGVVYRSAQLEATALPEIIHRLGIKSVINLRGENLGSTWYVVEKSCVLGGGLSFFNLRLSARRVMTIAEMDELVKMIQKAPKPVLIHCGSGSDRTGLACALYELDRGVPFMIAAGQLSLRYGHFPHLWSESKAMDDSLIIYYRTRRPDAHQISLTSLQ